MRITRKVDMFPGYIGTKIDNLTALYTNHNILVFFHNLKLIIHAVIIDYS